MPTKNTRASETRKSNAIVPRFVSQHTAPAVLGFKTGRAYLEWLETAGCRVVSRGKDRLVLVSEAEEVLLRDAGDGTAPLPSSADEPVTPERILASIGRTHAGGAR